MTTRTRRRAARGEPYAERYADLVFARRWQGVEPAALAGTLLG